MKTKDKMFYRYTKQSYARFDSTGKCISLYDNKLDEIMVGIYPDSGNQETTGEFSISWIKPYGKNMSHIKLFNDSWHLLSELPELFAVLAKKADKNPTPNDIEDLLIELGYKSKLM